MLEEDDGRRVCPLQLLLVCPSFEPLGCSNEIALLFENNSLVLGCDSGECLCRFRGVPMLLGMCEYDPCLVSLA